MLNIIHLVDGNTTLNTTVGKNQTLSVEIAEHINKCCHLPEIPSKKLYIKQMSDSDFASFLEFTEAEEQLTLASPRQIKDAQQYQLTWSEGGSVYINRYNSKAFSVQGNSNHIKEKIV